VCEKRVARERAPVYFSRVSPSRACTCTRNVVSALIGDHVDYRWSIGKRDLLNGHFVVRMLTDLPASLSLSPKEYRLPPRGPRAATSCSPRRVAASRRHVAAISQFACKRRVKIYAFFSRPPHPHATRHYKIVSRKTILVSFDLTGQSLRRWKIRSSFASNFFFNFININ